MPTLILTPRFTGDAQVLWRAATCLGWDVERLQAWRVPEDLRTVQEPVLYVEALFGPTLAEQFGLRLLEPPADWLVQLPDAYRKRTVRITSLGQACLLPAPAFVKPPNDKSFPARVYSGAELPAEYDDDMPVLVQEIVNWEKEFRCFILDRKLRTFSIYLRGGELQRDQDFTHSESEELETRRFVESLLADARIDLPQAAVLDVGVITERGWAVIEQNAAWGSGIYGCHPEQVLEVLRHAAIPV